MTELNRSDLVKAHICYLISEGQKSSPGLAEPLTRLKFSVGWNYDLFSRFH